MQRKTLGAVIVTTGAVGLLSLAAIVAVVTERAEVLQPVVEFASVSQLVAAPADTEVVTTGPTHVLVPLEDFGYFVTLLNVVPLPPPAEYPYRRVAQGDGFDLDADGDVDLHDFALLQRLACWADGVFFAVADDE